jgi:hypothetical protein
VERVTTDIDRVTGGRAVRHQPLEVPD